MAALAQAKVRATLTYDPTQPGDYQPHVNIYPASVGPGMFPLAMFISLAAVSMGLQVSFPDWWKWLRLER